MARSCTPPFVVETHENFGRRQVMAWRGRKAPSESALRSWLETYNRSFLASGVNAHVSQAMGYEVYASRAVVRRNAPGTSPIVSASMPMFWVP